MNECSAKKQGSQDCTTIRHWKKTFSVHFQIMTWVQERFFFCKKLMIKNNTSLKKSRKMTLKILFALVMKKKKKNILV